MTRFPNSFKKFTMRTNVSIRALNIHKFKSTPNCKIKGGQHNLQNNKQNFLG